MKQVTDFLTKYWWVIAIAVVLIYGYTQGWFNKLLGMDPSVPANGTACVLTPASGTTPAVMGVYANGVCVAATAGGRFAPVNGRLVYANGSAPMAPKWEAY